MNRKVLLVFPHNFLERKSGVHTRIYNLCLYLKKRGFTIDQYALKNYESNWNDEDYYGNEMVNRFFFFDWSVYQNEMQKPTAKISKWLEFPKSVLPDCTSPSMLRQFDGILKDNHYDYLIIVYAYWYKLALNRRLKGTEKIILIEDFLTKQELKAGDKLFSRMVADETRRINMFDVAISISKDEYDYFSKNAVRPRHHLIPVFFQKPKKLVKSKTKYDVTFIGFNNVHNVRGVNWFLENVAVKIPKIKIAIIGKVNDAIIRRKLANVTYIDHVKKIEDVYSNTRITVCPMFSGTGMKVKIVESIMYGKPCISTTFGLKGFADKEHNGCVVADTPSEFISAIKKLLSDKPFYNTVSREGSDYFLKNFEESAVYKKLDIIFHNSQRS